MFKLNNGFVLNLVFLAISAVLGWLWWSGRSSGASHEHHDHGGASRSEQVLTGIAVIAMTWLAGGLLAAARPGFQASGGG